jgi:hypothetical protein
VCMVGRQVWPKGQMGSLTAGRLAHVHSWELETRYGSGTQAIPLRPRDAGEREGAELRLQDLRSEGSKEGEILGVSWICVGCGGLEQAPLTAACWPPGVLGSPLISLLFWILICFSIAALFTKRYSIRPLIVALILRSIYYLGIGPTLNILGALNVSTGGNPSPSHSIAYHVVGLGAGLPIPATDLPCPLCVGDIIDQAHYRPVVSAIVCLLPSLDNCGQLALGQTDRSHFEAAASRLSWWHTALFMDGHSWQMEIKCLEQGGLFPN